MKEEEENFEGKIFRNIRESRQIATLDGKNVE